ncbi:MAG: 50S ribosomal protein L21 [Patescibacteria group bacterium]|jgi:large subunit ribosomal protein L21
MKAIIRTGGKQYLIATGQKLSVERIKGTTAGQTVVFEEVLAIIDDKENITVGAPLVKGAKVEATLVKEFKEKKIDVFKYHNKTRYRKRYGHRQIKEEVNIEKIVTK